VRLFLVAGACAALLGCDSLSQKVDASRQDRCERADWALVGERDGVAGPSSYADRYEFICGELFKPDEYRAAFQKGAARRPRPPV
jgi:hypothetical protein